jgi:hypothetical protein
LRTKDAVTPSLTTGDVWFSLIAYIAVYVTIYATLCTGGLHARLALRDPCPAAQPRI